jgi:ketosteroid isomerase-like protein
VTATERTRDLLSELYEAFGSGETSVWADNLADDVTLIGSDAAEWYEGRQTVAKLVAEQLTQMSAAGITVRSGSARLFSSGDVVWAIDRPTVELPDGTTVQMRLTLITSEQAGRLVIRHFHLSTGAPNEEVLGEDLTTE